MTDPASFEQEYEINFGAKLGTLLYPMVADATLCESFPVPEKWTRYFSLDPHPRVPHAALWLAVDPWGDAWVYRELWPSKIYGKRGNIPEDDNRFTIKEYVQTLKWLEGATNPENDGKPERIAKRVIDYEARAFGLGTSDDPVQPNFQQRFEQCGLDEGLPLIFVDAVKDHETGIESVNNWLKPRAVEQNDGKFKMLSRLHIFSDRCPELIHQMNNNRYQPLTPLLAERQDPSSKPVDKRNHLTDCLRYLCMSGLEYISAVKPRDTWEPMVAGIAY